MCLSWDAITMFPFRKRIVTYFLLGLTMLYTVGGLPELIRIGEYALNVTFHTLHPTCIVNNYYDNIDT